VGTRRATEERHGDGEGRLLSGRYRLLRRLGAGGMASVWAAHDDRLGREVAVKLLSDVLAGDEAYLRRFDREARVVAGLNHPNLVGIFDFSNERDRPYLVMELIGGGTLAGRMTSGRLDELDVDQLAHELLLALEYIHDAGVVHRDLKPANILFDLSGRPRVADFGIAQPEDATSLTKTGQLVGTLGYMAPEVQSAGPATPRADVYSLGVLLRECGGAASPRLEPLIAEMTAHDAKHRPSAGEALGRLSDATRPTEPLTATAATAPTVVAPVTAPTAPQRPPSRTVSLLLAALALFVALAVGVALSRGGENGEREGAPAASETRAPPAESTPAALANDCATIEAEKKRLEEEHKAAEEAAGDDPATKEENNKRFEDQKKALEEQAKGCED